MTDFIPLPHTIFILYAGTSVGIPAPKETCLPIPWPKPAGKIFPTTTSSISLIGTFVSSNIFLTTSLANFAGWTVLNEPKKLPIGVLFAETI